MDFTLKVLKNLLISLSKYNYNYSHNYNNDNFKTVVLRHDIDKNPGNALKTAKIENELGICGIYYFRIHPKVFKPDIITEIAALGHIIGYHYEDFSKNHGISNKAIISFQQNLENFRKIIKVKTICMDGRPLSKYNNLDLWKYYNYRDYEIDFEPYLDIDFSKVLYLTDTGRGWNLIKYSVRDKVRNPFNYHDKTTHELIADIEKGTLPDKLMITIHPQRWHDHFLPWLRELLLQRLKNIVKWGLIKLRNDRIH
jgi:hypothetical protein